MSTEKVTGWYAIDVPRLKKDLTGKEKLPLDFEWGPAPLLVYCRSVRYGKDVEPVQLNIKVTASHKQGDENTSKHRVITKCDCCGKWIPLGRIQQHYYYGVKRGDH